MTENEKQSLAELIGEAKNLNERQKIYLAGVVDGMEASKKEDK